MKFEDWEKWYSTILDDFNFSKEMDENSAFVLNKILSESGSYSLDNLKEFVKNIVDNNNSFMVFGAGPSLKKHVKYLKDNYSKFNNYVIIAADGATSGLVEEDIIPDIVVTDLDGKIDDLLIANDKGAFFVIHAHGNNLEFIAKHTETFKKVIGTTQSSSSGKLFNFGGFTDGDRAVFLAIALGAKNICLGGMDFGKYVTNYSRPNLSRSVEIADKVKQKKLVYAEKLVKWADDNNNVNIRFM
ncbi:6-hydroxymethylpterin diphosphokinase MptE-like protein [Methanobrevibacter filiformis]|uniref:6-hydroxymethyl-7,8-dihydropterin pyrophosphokinase n=1 Tax=Methanobrevibacter filiformis TaxID=55758 RepID=A0A166CR87_9EURY|nr:6-hydroxymethylpterin diphosphokinase MptE-like protein [Methanobrevibacter filiformis]KZX16207.1 hypothetical protein MBFIL_05370 [Methanobrevibacter filiformis]